MYSCIFTTSTSIIITDKTHQQLRNFKIKFFKKGLITHASDKIVRRHIQSTKCLKLSSSVLGEGIQMRLT